MSNAALLPKILVVEQRLLEILEQALPDTAEAELVDLLDFIQVQHSGSSLNPDNTRCADAIVDFVRQRPFAASQRGVEALARLARHAAGAAERREGAAGGAPPITPEHHLWLLTSSALNTAAAICASGGADPALTFARIESGGAERARYLERMYAKDAMRELGRSSQPPRLTASSSRDLGAQAGAPAPAAARRAPASWWRTLLLLSAAAAAASTAYAIWSVDETRLSELDVE